MLKSEGVKTFPTEKLGIIFRSFGACKREGWSNHPSQQLGGWWTAPPYWFIWGGGQNVRWAVWDWCRFQRLFIPLKNGECPRTHNSSPPIILLNDRPPGGVHFHFPETSQLLPEKKTTVFFRSHTITPKGGLVILVTWPYNPTVWPNMKENKNDGKSPDSSTIFLLGRHFPPYPFCAVFKELPACPPVIQFHTHTQKRCGMPLGSVFNEKS